MALLEDTAFDSSTKKDLLRLNEVLHHCDAENLGIYALRRSPSIDSFYAKSLSRLVGTAEVFDDTIYEQEVLNSAIPADELYEDLKEKAQLIGVPVTHLPYKRPGKEQIILGLTEKRTSEHKMPSEPYLMYPPPPVPPKSPRLSSSDRPKSSRSFKAPSFVSRKAMSFQSTNKGMQGAAMLIPSPELDLKTIQPSSSVSSFFSNASHVSSVPSTASKRNRFRDFFRGPARRTSYQTVETARSLASNRDDILSISTEATLVPSASVADFSLESSPTSVRSSTSSSIDMPAVPLGHRRKLERALKSPEFVQLRKDCQLEADRFSDFIAQQRAALPLIYGRNRLYLIERRETEISNLEEKHDGVLQSLEDQHTRQECAEIERQRIARTEKEQANAIALKHVTSRMTALGEEATEEDHKRLQEEQNALKTFDIRQEHRLTKMRRDQGRYRTQIEREQRLELQKLKEKYKEEFTRTSTSKKDELGLNLRKLESLVNKRRQDILNKWHVELQIFKYENEDLKEMWADRQLPLQVLGRPLDTLEMTKISR